MNRVCLLLILILLTARCQKPSRTPASTIAPENEIGTSIRDVPQYNMMNSLTDACDRSRPDSSGFSMCAPYVKVKSRVDATGKEVVDVLNDYVPQTVSGMTGILLKSLYEKQIRLEVRTGFGSPFVSFSDKDTQLKWNWTYNF